MLLLHLLLHVLIYHLLSAKEGPRDSVKTNEEQQRLYASKPKDTNYIVKRIEKCPNVGYYFTREPAPNSIDPGPCYLCFCQSDQTAVCWKRDNRRCNVDSFYYHGVGKRDSSIAPTKTPRSGRVRRGFADIFFRDASRDVFNRNTEDQQCKPYESSFSEDCPPADWCIGCTVCDCDPNGRWDCHILSFCPEKKKGKKSKSDNGPPRKIVKKKPVPKTTPAPKIPSTKTKQSKPTIRRSANNNQSSSPKRVVKSVTRNKNNENKKQQKKKPPLRFQKISPKTKTTMPMVIKKNITSHKPLQLKGNKIAKVIKNHDNNTVILAQQVVRRVMDAVKQMVQREMKNVTKMVSGGRSEMNNTKANKNAPKPGEKKPAQRQGRGKREVSIDSATSGLSSTVINETGENIHASTAVTEASSVVPLTSNVLNDITESFTSSPILSSTDSENEYYKYIVGAVNALSIIPMEPKPPKDKFNITNETEIKNLETNEVNVIDIDEIRLPEINVSKTNEMTTITENNTKKITIDVVNDGELNDTIYVSPKISGTEADKEETAAIRLQNTPSKVTTSNDANIEHIVEVRLQNISTTVTSGTETNKGETAAVTLQNIPSAATNVNFASDENGLEIMPDTLKYLTDFPPEASELKIFKWQQLKKVKFPIAKNRNVVRILANKTEKPEEPKNKLRTKDIGRLTVSKKYNLIKILKHHKCPFLNSVVNQNSSTVQSDTKTKDVNSLLGKILKIYNYTKTTKPPRKLKKFNVIRYLKKIFYNIFQHKNSAGRLSRNHIIETLCEHFGPCTKNIKDKTLLRSKLAELDHETLSILKTVKIIKGLLRLLDGPTQSNEIPHSQANLRNDIQRLNSIMKNNYVNSKKSLTQTELIQIEYLKRNTQDFMKSIGKFTILLNEIINILTKKDVSNIDGRKLINKYPPKDPFKSLKSLLLRYNLVQNNFMKRMYELLNNYNDKMSEKPRAVTTLDLNSTEQIEVLSKNIIKNLRKLKNLAQTMKNNGRSKREAKDDAIEYLLMLMEFLLKQNHPLDAAPDNDGIDLLIDAIKNAPDIKTVRKKVLDNAPLPGTNGVPLRMHVHHSNSENSRTISEDSPSISENHSSEDAGNLKIEYNEDIKPKADEPKDLFDMIEEDKDSFDRFQFDRRAGVTLESVTNETNDVTTPEVTELPNIINAADITTLSNLDIDADFQADVNRADHKNSFNMYTDSVVTDSDNSYNYNTDNNTNLFSNSAGIRHLENNIETENTEIGKTNIVSNVFSDNSVNLFEDNIENRNMDLDKNNNYDNVFIADTGLKNMDHRKNNKIDNIFNDNVDTSYIENDQNEKNANNYNEHTENGNMVVDKKNDNNNMIYNDITEHKSTNNNKNINNLNEFDGNIENNNIDSSKNNNGNVVYSDNAENVNNITHKADNSPDNTNNYNSISETANNYNNIPETGNHYNSIPEIITNHNSIPESANNYNSVPENGNSYNSAPDNVNNYNIIPEEDNNYSNMSESSIAKKPVAQVTIAVTEDNNLATKNDGIKKFQAVYTGDLEEDVTPLTAAEVEMYTATTEFSEWTKKPKSKTFKKIDLSDNESSDKKSKLEWIVENFGRDAKNYEDERDHEEKRHNVDHSTTKMNTALPGKTDSTVTPTKTDVNIINEEEEKERKKIAKINAEEVMLKKQMDLLNSLDYGTERAEFDESDSKDGNTDERYSDAFSAFFV